MTGLLWTREDMVTATGGTAHGDWSGVSGISIDTRELAGGDLFVALAGISHDGHVYMKQALAAGAGAAMVSAIPPDLPADAALLVVPDTLKALEDLGRAARARTDARVIAVTGSVGKTSTKDMLRTMLSPQGRTHAATRSFNNHWGVPLTLARMPADTEFAVIEIGMNHPGEITPLSRMARPHVALITTVEAVHMAAFNSVEEIADAKAEIFAGLEPGGTAILNADNDHFARLEAQTGGARIIGFGTRGVGAEMLEASVREGVTIVRAVFNGAQATYKIGAPGAHLARNSVGAVAAVEAAGGDVARAMLSLATWKASSGRGSQSRILLGPRGMDGTITLLDESYNANPASMRAALAVLAATPVTHNIGRVSRGRRLAYLGDMLELGPDEQAMHAGLATCEEMAGVDRVHCCGPLMKSLHEALPADKRGLFCADSQELSLALAKTIDAGDVCMVKGSLGARMGRVVDAIRALDNSGSSADSEDL